MHAATAAAASAGVRVIASGGALVPQGAAKADVPQQAASPW